MSQEKLPETFVSSGIEKLAIIVALLLTLAVTVLSMTVFRSPDFRADLDFLMALQEFREYSHNAFTGFILFVTEFGGGKFTLLMLVLIYFGFSTRLGTFLVQAAGYSEMLNGLLKLTVCALRPWVRDELIIPPGDAKAAATGYSFPSGHSANATAVFGGIAVKTWGRSRILLAAAFVMLLLILFSRNYLGVHTPQDVLVGLISTLALILVMNRVFRWLDRGSSKTRKAWILFLVSVAVSIISAAYFELKSYPEVADAAGKLVVDPSKMVLNSYKGIGYYLGVSAALVFLQYFRGYDTGNVPALRRLGVTIAGMLLLLFLYTVVTPFLSQILPHRYARLLGGFSVMFITFGVFPVLAASRNASGNSEVSAVPAPEA